MWQDEGDPRDTLNKTCLCAIKFKVQGSGGRGIRKLLASVLPKEAHTAATAEGERVSLAKSGGKGA